MENIFKIKYDEMNHHQKQTYILYISELLHSNKEFKFNLDALIVNCFKKGAIPPKKVTLQDFTVEELADLFNPINI